jgi:uncharacterized protein YciI
MPFFAVIRERAAAWDWSRPIEGQDGWDEHAQYMDELVDQGLIILGGPLREGDRVLFAIEADSVDTVRARFDADPWTPTAHLSTASIEPWHVRLDGR